MKYWSAIRQLVLGGGAELITIKRSVDRIYDNQDHTKRVEESFAKGIKPPVKLTDEEKHELLKLIEIVQSRLKKGIVNRNFTRNVESRSQLLNGDKTKGK